MIGDIRELQVSREAIADGTGGEVPGLVVRVWLESGDGDHVLAHELSSRIESPHDVDGAREWAIGWLNSVVES